MKTEITDIGILHTDKEYFSFPAVSSGRLKEFLKSPAHYQNYGTVFKESEDMRIGTAVHKYVLGGKYMVIYRENKTGEQASEDIRTARGAGGVSVHESSRETIEAMTAAIMADPTARKLLVDLPGEIEQGFYWKHESGLLCKAKPDKLSMSEKQDKTIIPVDLKTCRDGSPDGFKYACKNFHYPVQAAFYTMGLKAKYPDYEIAPFHFVMVEKTEPYYIGIYTIDLFSMYEVTEWIHFSLDKISNMQDFHGYGNPKHRAGIIEIELPTYYQQKFNIS